MIPRWQVCDFDYRNNAAESANTLQLGAPLQRDYPQRIFFEPAARAPPPRAPLPHTRSAAVPPAYLCLATEPFTECHLVRPKVSALLH